MSRIKSAWEIALEKTENIEIDKERIKEKEEIERIRRIVGTFLSSDNPDEQDLKEKLKPFNQKAVKEALKIAILNGLSLPQEEINDDRYERLAVLLSAGWGGNSSLNGLLNQITGYLKQYPLHKKQLLEQMKAQFEPMLREKEEKLSEQYGEKINLSLEDDKEFLEVLKQNLDRLNQMYDQTLIKAKDELKDGLK